MGQSGCGIGVQVNVYEYWKAIPTASSRSTTTDTSLHRAARTVPSKSGTSVQAISSLYMGTMNGSTRSCFGMGRPVLAISTPLRCQVSHDTVYLLLVLRQPRRRKYRRLMLELCSSQLRTTGRSSFGIWFSRRVSGLLRDIRRKCRV